MVKGAIIENEQATIKLQNITGGEIKNLKVSPNQNFEECSIVPTTVAAGGEITIVCEVVGQPTGSVDITFDDYAGLEQTVNISGGGPIPQSPGGETICDDGLNNDFEDGIDCEDIDCVNDPACLTSPEEICDQTGDEDNDGDADCADEDCDALTGPSGETCEPNGETLCDDSYDNDGDNLTDCAEDPNCSTEPECQLPPEDCEATGDEDQDGQADCLDFSDCPEGTYCNAAHTMTCQGFSCAPVEESFSTCKKLTQAGKTYKLSEDLTGSEVVAIEGKGCIVVAASNITVDCQNHWIKNTEMAEIAGVYSNYSNTTIKNCKVQLLWDYYDGGDGIKLDGSADNSTLTNNYLYRNRHGVYMYSVSGTTISNSTINQNKRDGIKMYYSSSNTITGNTFFNNLRDGIDLFGSTARYNDITGNTLSWNSHDISLDGGANNNTVSNNSITANQMWGISLIHGSNYNQILNNTITTTTGNSGTVRIFLRDNSTRNTFTGNTVCGSVGKDFYCSDSAQNTSGGNTFGINSNCGWLETAPGC